MSRRRLTQRFNVVGHAQLGRETRSLRVLTRGKLKLMSAICVLVLASAPSARVND